MQDWAEIRRLYQAERMSISEIARRIGVSRLTVRRALSSSGPPKYERAPSGSATDDFDAAIRALLSDHPRMPATVIAERVGWTRGMTVFKQKVATLRPLYLPPDPASRTSYLPGQIAQFDFWFPPITLQVGHGQSRTAKRLPVLTMACGYSRWRGALLVPSRSEQDLYPGWWALLERLGAVPKVLVWDGERAVGRYRRPDPELTAACHAFRGVLGAKVLICKPADPEAKGLLERTHDHYEKSFLPGRTLHWPGRLQHPAGRVRGNLEHAVDAGPGVSASRPDRHRPGSDDAATAGGPGHRVVHLPDPAPGPLRAVGLQRLLGPPQCHRSTGPGAGRPGSGHRLVRGQARSRSPPFLGPAPDLHRPRARRLGGGTATVQVRTGRGLGTGAAARDGGPGAGAVQL